MSKGEGKKIAIKFSLPIIGNVEGNEGAFTVSGQEYLYTDGPNHNGVLVSKNYSVESIERRPVGTLYEENFDGGALVDVEVTTNGLRLGVDD